MLQVWINCTLTEAMETDLGVEIKPETKKEGKRCHEINSFKIRNTIPPYFFIADKLHHVCFNTLFGKTTTLKPQEKQVPCFRFDVKKAHKVKTFPLQQDPEHTSNMHHHFPGSALTKLTKTINVMAPLMLTSFTQLFHSGKKTAVKTFYL